MGACNSLPNGENGSSNINQKGPNDGKDKTDTTNIFIVGPHQSGKTTFFKQVMALSGMTIDDDDRKYYTSIVHNNVLHTMSVLCQECRRYGHISAESEEAFDYFDSRFDSDVVDERVAEYAHKLWNEAAIKKTFEHRYEFYLKNAENIGHFFDKLASVLTQDYVPTDEDIIRVGIRTTAFNQYEFTYMNHHFTIIDSGGLRSERVKWPARLKDAHAVVFAVALSEYNEQLCEDTEINRLDESLRLFQDISSLSQFHTTPILLLFTKSDTLDHKIQEYDLARYQPSYTGPVNDANAAYNWISSRFLDFKTDRQVFIPARVNCLDLDSIKSALNLLCAQLNQDSSPATAASSS